eukprot:scaffold56133_cov16-Tisochrysis_lutea.AAC.1
MERDKDGKDREDAKSLCFTSANELMHMSCVPSSSNKQPLSHPAASGSAPQGLNGRCAEWKEKLLNPPLQKGLPQNNAAATRTDQCVKGSSVSDENDKRRAGLIPCGLTLGDLREKVGTYHSILYSISRLLSVDLLALAHRHPANTPPPLAVLGIVLSPNLSQRCMDGTLGWEGTYDEEQRAHLAGRASMMKSSREGGGGYWMNANGANHQHLCTRNNDSIWNSRVRKAGPTVARCSCCLLLTHTRISGCSNTLAVLGSAWQASLLTASTRPTQSY